jgi:hypothetical protein
MAGKVINSTLGSVIESDGVLGEAVRLQEQPLSFKPSAGWAS